MQKNSHLCILMLLKYIFFLNVSFFRNAMNQALYLGSDLYDDEDDEDHGNDDHDDDPDHQEARGPR